MSSRINQLKRRQRIMNDHAGRSIARLPETAPTPEEIAFAAGPKCGFCIHWRRLPKPLVAIHPAALARMSPTERAAAQAQCDLQNSGADLSIPPMGECRERLHSLPVVQQDGKGGIVVPSWISGYPSPVAADFRGCGQFAPRLEALAPDLRGVDAGE